MSEANRALAIRFIEAMGSNDAEGFAACLAPDAVAIAKGSTHFAGARSREMMIGGVEAFKSILPGGLRLEIVALTVDGDRVAAECRGNAMTADGARYANDYCFVLTIRDGLVASVNEYFCTRLADEVLWPRVQGTGNLDSTVD